MILSCPQCSAQFKVPESAIPDEGRNVKCSSCGNIWFTAKPKPERSVEEQINEFSEDIKTHLDDLKSLVVDDDIKVIPTDFGSSKDISSDLEDFDLLIFEENVPTNIKPLEEHHDDTDYLVFGDDTVFDSPPLEEQNHEHDEFQSSFMKNTETNKTSASKASEQTTTAKKKLKPTTLYTKARRKPFHEMDSAWAFSYATLCALIFVLIYFSLSAARPVLQNTFLAGFYDLANMLPDQGLKIETVSTTTEKIAANENQANVYKIRVKTFIRNTSKEVQTIGKIRYSFFDKDLNPIDNLAADLDRSLSPGELSTVEDILHSVPSNSIYMAIDFGSGTDIFVRNMDKLSHD